MIHSYPLKQFYCLRNENLYDCTSHQLNSMYAVIYILASGRFLPASSFSAQTRYFLDESSHIYMRVCPSVRPKRVFSNEPIMGENGRKRLGKKFKRSKLVKKSSEFFQNLLICPKMSQNDQFRCIRLVFFFVQYL